MLRRETYRGGSYGPSSSSVCCRYRTYADVRSPISANSLAASRARSCGPIKCISKIKASAAYQGLHNSQPIASSSALRKLASDHGRVIGAVIVYKKYVQPAGVILLKQRADRMANSIYFIPCRNNDSNGPNRHCLLRRW